ncbi:MAG: S8 family serine peptidase [Desulfitobacteriaceae bacterium]|nr:S8 family serine peptidase [Desulfitobacteriaceae bacterium]
MKSRNQSFDLVITEKYMTSEDLLSEMVEEGIEENIEYIQPDYQLMPASLNSDINDPYFTEQWGLGPKETLQPIPQNNLKKSQTDSFYKKDMGINANVFQAWGQSQGEGVIVAVLDTGIDITHEDLQENIWVKSLTLVMIGITGYSKLHLIMMESAGTTIPWGR